MKFLRGLISNDFPKTLRAQSGSVVERLNRTKRLEKGRLEREAPTRCRLIHNGQ